MSDLTAAVARIFSNPALHQMPVPSRFATDFSVIKKSTEADFDPEDHPRDDAGKFAFKGLAEWQSSDKEDKKTKQAAIDHAQKIAGEGHDPSGTEANRLRKYQNFAFRRVNGQLRKGDAYDPSVIADPSKMDLKTTVGNMVKSLDDAIGRSKIKEDTVVYHGLSVPREKLVGLKPGDVLTDPGYTSTSLLSSVAAQFGGDMAKIQISAGSTGLAMDAAGIKGSAGMYGPKQWKVSEGEILLPRDAKFRVVSVTDNVDQGKEHDEDLKAGMGSMRFALEYIGADPSPRATKAKKAEPANA